MTNEATVIKPVESVAVDALRTRSTIEYPYLASGNSLQLH